MPSVRLAFGCQEKDSGKIERLQRRLREIEMRASHTAYTVYMSCFNVF